MYLPYCSRAIATVRFRCGQRLPIDLVNSDSDATMSPAPLSITGEGQLIANHYVGEFNALESHASRCRCAWTFRQGGEVVLSIDPSASAPSR